MTEEIFASSGGTVQVVFFLVPGFSMMAFASCLEPMRIANMVTDKQVYRWTLCTRDGAGVGASNGITVHPQEALSALQSPSNLVVCSGVKAHDFRDNMVFGWLRRWAREGCRLGSLCTGAHVLARAGLLNGYRCTVHWANLDSMVEEFPHLELSSRLYEQDKDRFTCAGGVAASDMVLQDITVRLGEGVASEVAEQLMHERIRSSGDSQKLPFRLRLRVNHPKLVQSIGVMEAHMETPLSCTEVARACGLWRRQLERLFRRHLNTSPARYYLKLRLERGRTLLEQTTLPVQEVAFASGFTSASHFTKCYRTMYGHTPRAERNKATSPRP